MATVYEERAKVFKALCDERRQRMGEASLQVIKEINPEIPVIMLSSAGTSQKLKQTLELGALDFIQKPYTSEQIKQAVEQIRRKVEKNHGK